MQVQQLNFALDLMRAILWQYEDATNLQGLVVAKQAWYDANQERFWHNWCRDVFSLETANDFGLTVWGIILDEGRDAFVGAARTDYPAFGFAGHRNFGRGNFKRASSGYITLGTDAYRLLLRLRYYKMVSRGTVPEINALLQMLFGAQGGAHVLDGGNMTLTYVFRFQPEAWQRFILQDMDALPRPAGVGIKMTVLTRNSFGFGPHHANFNGTFAATNGGV